MVVLVSNDKNGIILGQTNVFTQHPTGATEITRCKKGGCRSVMNVSMTEKS
jgi:hypothetical protein